MTTTCKHTLVISMLAAWLAATGCSSKKLEVGEKCLLNTDCNSPLVCTIGTCHMGCRETRDCPAGQSCTMAGGIGVCQLPAESECSAVVACGPLWICANDLRCRANCSAAADCAGGQVCVQGFCADTKELDVTTGQLPQKQPLPDGGQPDSSLPGLVDTASVADSPGTDLPDRGLPDAALPPLDAVAPVVIDSAFVGEPDTGTILSFSCGNGVLEPGEGCDCGSDVQRKPATCVASNGIFFGDGAGCSMTCSREPVCRDEAGKNRPCDPVCGDGSRDPSEGCDDGNLIDGDGCASNCQPESGFTCTTQAVQAGQTCQSGAGQCLTLPVIYRDFQPENATAGGHPDFPFLGTKYGGAGYPTTICVPDSSGPAKGNDSTARCWGMLDNNLLAGKPQPGATTTCACQFSDSSIGYSSRIPGNYSQAGNDSPLSDGKGGFQGGTVNSIVNTASAAGAYDGSLIGFTPTTPSGPIWKGTAPAYKNASSLSQWWNDDSSVNKTYPSVLELASIGANIYQYANQSHLAQGGFYPLDVLNPSQASLCNLWPYWNHGSGTPFWLTCAGDQYLYPPRVVQSDCPSQSPLGNGCWVSNVLGVRHNFYFTSEVHHYFVYDAGAGFELRALADTDLFVFLNGQLVLDLGGIHQQLPGKVTIAGDPGSARVTEGGCLDSGGNIVGAEAGSTACALGSSPPPPGALVADDFRVRTVPLALVSGKTYELAIFHANRSPVDSNFQLTLSGLTTMRSVCVRN
jgi:cysteine-rich repeat protein